METERVSSSSSSEESANDAANESDEQPPTSVQEPSGQESSEPSTTQASNSTTSTQKRRRVTRACDECRRKKIKCDGMQPCTHCTVYSYECTYDQPSNRRRNPTPQYVSALEHRLQRAEALLRNALPDVNLDDPQLDAGLPQRIHPQIKQEAPSQTPTSSTAPLAPARPHKGSDRSSVSSENLLESMVNNTGSLDLDDQGNWDYHGQSSSLVYLRRLREQFGDLMGQAEGYGLPFLQTCSISSPIRSPRSPAGSPMEQSLPNVHDLPPRECAKLLCESALDDACALMRIVHLPTFWASFDRAFDLTPEQYRDAENRFLPLLYVALSLGAVFAKAECSHLQRWGYENAIDQGFTWFNASRSMIDVTECRDLTSLQIILFMILFLQCSSRLSTCYSHIGIALGGSIRMGLHRSIAGDFNPIEQEIRKRIFWVVRKMDIYVAALLGLPIYVSDNDIDQDTPLEVDDDYITSNEILPMPPGKLSLLTAFNAHTRLIRILAKTTRYIYPVKGSPPGCKQSNAVSHARVREIEQDLQAWMEGLPMALRPSGGEAPPEIERVQQRLRMAFAHVQMFLYRPFLHYISQKSPAKMTDKRSYACAAACVSVSRNIIHISDEMKKRGLLNGSYWFYMYTLFFAILTLVFFVLENPSSSTTQDIMKDALAGKETLASLARTSRAADKSMQILAGLFEQLPHRLKGARSRPKSQKKRPPSSSENTRETAQMTQSVRSAPKIAMKPSPKSVESKESAEGSPGAVKQPTKQAPVSSDLSSPYKMQVTNTPSDRQGGPDDPYSPESGMTASFGSASATPSSSTRPTFDPNQQYSSTLPDMGVIMFPSADPFDYPNQPIMTLENQNLFRPEDTHMFGTSNTMDAQPFASLPLYMTSAFGFQPMSTTMDFTSAGNSGSTMATDDTAGRWSSEQPPNPSGSGGLPMNYNNFFGQNWMDQNYRQN